MVYNWLLEAQVEFGVAAAIVALRVFARCKTVGFARWQGDDYLILIALSTYAALTALYPKLYAGNLIQRHPRHMTPQQKQTWTTSAKYNQILWGLYVLYIWCLKGCMLFFYARLTRNIPRYRLVKITAWLCALTFIICVVEMYTHCLPLYKKWQMTPYPGRVCRTSMVNFYTVGSLNFITDAVLLSIPIPLLYRLNATTKRKMAVGVLLCSGVFVMCATAIRAVSGVVSVYDGRVKRNNVTIAFACRENFVSMVVVNAPCIKPLLFPSSWLKKKAVLPVFSSTGGASTPETPSVRKAPSSTVEMRSMYADTESPAGSSADLMKAGVTRTAAER